jgi:hypothetical protein
MIKSATIGLIAGHHAVTEVEEVEAHPGGTQTVHRR